ncbi:pseudoazurin [Pseudomonas monteilii]
MLLRTLALSLLTTAFAPTALAEVHEVHMLTRGAEGAMVYEPDHLHIAPGDSVRFLPTQSGHNAASLPDLWPDGAPTFKGPINQPMTYTFDVPGRYGIQCIPHLAMGMVMLIEVGPSSAQPLVVPSGLPARAQARLTLQAQRLEATP